MNWRHRQFFGTGSEPLHKTVLGLMILIPIWTVIGLTATCLVIVALK